MTSPTDTAPETPRTDAIKKMLHEKYSGSLSDSYKLVYYMEAAECYGQECAALERALSDCRKELEAKDIAARHLEKEYVAASRLAAHAERASSGTVKYEHAGYAQQAECEQGWNDRGLPGIGTLPGEVDATAPSPAGPDALAEVSARLEVLRRSAERGLAEAQSGKNNVDVWQHVLDELPRVAAALRSRPADRDAERQTLLEFFSKHALGPKMRPSCLVCGKTPIEWPPAIQHVELPGIVVCRGCRDAAMSQQEGK
jgi:hypothetical protein